MRNGWIRFLLGAVIGVGVAFVVAKTLRPPPGPPLGPSAERLPRDVVEEMAPRMASFVRALSEKPTRIDAPPDWKPLLTRPDATRLHCAACHGEEGGEWEADIAEGSLDGAGPPEELRRRRMIRLMESWVTKVNRDLKPLLRKAVVCIDCHDRDPRGAG
ncbi:MAG: hypothetical protein AAGD14_10220 [Planctomycetota bacterium]